MLFKSSILSSRFLVFMLLIVSNRDFTTGLVTIFFALMIAFWGTFFTVVSLLAIFWTLVDSFFSLATFLTLIGSFLTLVGSFFSLAPFSHHLYSSIFLLFFVYLSYFP